MHIFDSEFNREKRDSNMNRPCTLDFMVLQITGSNQEICTLCCKNVPENKKPAFRYRNAGFWRTPAIPSIS